MALQVQDYPNKFDPGHPFAGAYARITQLNVNVRTGEGGASLAVFASKAAADAGSPPIDQLTVLLGQPIPGTDPPESTATLAELMQDPSFAAGYAAVANAIYSQAKRLPAFDGATDV